MMQNERENFNIELGEKLQEARQKIKLKQEDMANFLGCSRVHISHIENGYADISAYELKKYAEKCEINIANVLLYNGGATTAEAIMEHFTNEQIDTIINIFTQSKQLKDPGTKRKTIATDRKAFMAQISSMKNK